MARYFRKIIRVRGVDSPNVRLAEAEIARGLAPSGREITPGVLSWDLYQKRRKTWDAIRQTVGLDADWYEGAELLMFPPQWLNAAELRHEHLSLSGVKRQAKGMGVDPGEGGDDTAWAVADELGLMKLVKFKTPDTNIIPAVTIAMMKEYSLEPEQVVFDRGGGGKEHADRLRGSGYSVRSVGFGETPHIDPRYGSVFPPERLELMEERYVYANLRAQLFHELRLLLDPAGGVGGVDAEYSLAGRPRFALPASEAELRRQLAPIPLWYDGEGRIFLPPKRRRPDTKDQGRKTLEELIGCSPDEADAVVLAVHAILHPTTVARAGVLW